MTVEIPTFGRGGLGAPTRHAANVADDEEGLAQRPAAAAARSRLEFIDVVRGAVMVLMVLDHCRDYLHDSSFDPRLASEPAVFLTRWVTHFCAPTFVLLAGVSAYLYGRTRGVPALQRFLWTRGLWLVLLELSVVRIGWTFDLVPRQVLLQVIWALGVSMIGLAALVRLPRTGVAALAALLVAGHHLLDGVSARSFGRAGWLWNLLHAPDLATTPWGSRVWMLYPLIPWLGVIAGGYALGPVFERPAPRRRFALVAFGSALTVLFVLLRATNLYGNPTPWVAGGNTVETVLSFVNCEKYPPSLAYLAMTLGPVTIVLGLLSGSRELPSRARWLATIGSVPLFYYVAHIYVLHALALLHALATVGDASSLIGWFPPMKPEGYGLSLPMVYASTVLVVAALAVPCRWYAAVKRRRREWWWSYL